MTQVEAFYAVAVATTVVGLVMMGLGELVAARWPSAGMWVGWYGVGCFLLGLVMVWLGPTDGGA